MQRRERTRQLIELGGLVQKSGLVALLEDDRAALYGALLKMAETLSGATSADAIALARRRGKRAFEADGAGSAQGR